MVVVVAVVCKYSARAVVNVFEREGVVIALERMNIAEMPREHLAIEGVESAPKRVVAFFFQKVSGVNKSST